MTNIEAMAIRPKAEPFMSALRVAISTAAVVSLPWAVAYERQRLETAAALARAAPPVSEVIIKYRNGVVARVAVREEE